MTKEQSTKSADLQSGKIRQDNVITSIVNHIMEAWRSDRGRFGEAFGADSNGRRTANQAGDAEVTIPPSPEQGDVSLLHLGIIATALGCWLWLPLTQRWEWIPK